MPKRSFPKKQGRTSAQPNPISCRLGRAAHEKFTARAEALGLSLGGFAREALLQQLAQADEEAQGIAALREEVKSLRRELALATRAILTVSGAPVTPEQAEEWVRKNLNR